jgi:hypothetical protein
VKPLHVLLEKKLKTGKITFGLHVLLFRPANLHKRSDLQRHVANRDLTTQHGEFLNRTRGNEADAAGTNILNAAANSRNFQLPAGPKLGERLDRQFKALGEPRVVTAIALGCEFHAR